MYILLWTAEQARLLWSLCSSTEVDVRSWKIIKAECGESGQGQVRNGKSELREDKVIIPRYPIALSIRWNKIVTI